ncbi:NAD(P)-dependent oxidoreductase [Tsukamurella sp. PLM1]|uniref:NAD(P)-dependent oxidoreductase n=1 Tax=Tsukamurella sp. PLM1 TaxID=2929795 RepID=UPI00206BE57B|nr:NAD(P)-dependent oxidoreductase [Tsukamurella sp. PLM1]BDH56520.1 NAD-dependent L-serine dehydrogenase [Tsukamurella sp. PLM1]
MTEKIGFIGTGSMGSAIASRLVSDYDLYVNDRNRSSTDGLVGMGATFAPAVEIAGQCRFVFLCLPAPVHVMGLLFGDDGIADAFEPGTVVIDITTGTPTSDAEIVAGLAERGVKFLDSPIGGGVRRAADGTSTLMVGGDAAVFDSALRILNTVTPNVFRVGPSGAGHAMKLVNNLLNSCNRFAALECIRLGQAAGMDQDTIVEVLNSSTGRNYTTEYTFPTLLSGETYKKQGFTLELMVKDVHLANELADAYEHATPIGHLVEELTQQAINRFGPDADQSQLMAEWYPQR